MGYQASCHGRQPGGAGMRSGFMTQSEPRRPTIGQPALEQLLGGLTAVRGGDFGVRLDVTGDPLLDEIASEFNGMVGQLDLFTSEVTRVAHEVGTEGKLGGQA